MKTNMKVIGIKFCLALSLLAITGCGGGGGNSVPLPPPDLLPHRDAYAITDVGPVLYYAVNFLYEGGVTGLVALNNQGTITHNYGNGGGYWQNGKDNYIGSNGSSMAATVNINDSGQLTGTLDTGKPYYDPLDVEKRYPTPVWRAFLWQHGKFTELGALPLAAPTFYSPYIGKSRSEALAVNNAGQVVGTSDGDLSPRAFLYGSGKMTDLDTGLSTGSRAYGINDAGQVVGINGGHAALWQNGIVTDLGTLPGQQGSAAVAINSNGQIVGSSEPDNPVISHGHTEQRAVMWQNGKMQDLGALGGPSARAFGSSVRRI